MREDSPAPATGQHHSTLPVVIDSALEEINSSESDAYIWFVDLARPGGKYIRYRSDARPGPGAGFWRTYGSHPPELISPFAIARITPGRHGVEVVAIHPKSGDERLYEGDLDTVASDIHRAGKRRGDRQALFWALSDVCNEIRRRQAAARGVEE